LAKVVEWSANMMEEDAKRRLKTAELQAKKDRLKIWTTYVPPQTKSTAILDVNFSGKVRFGRISMQLDGGGYFVGASGQFPCE